jgi:type IV pilus assembly protein PilW
MFYERGRYVLPDRKASKKNYPNAGFSLVELLVVIVMFGTITIAGFSLFREQSRINQWQQNQLEMQSSARAAMQVLIQSFNHAGFGCSENISTGKDVAGEDNFLNPTNQNFTGTTPDSVTLVYGFDHVATVNGAVSESTLVTVDNSTNLGTTEYLKHISFFPSLSPNDFYEVVGKTATTITVDKSITRLTNNARIFRVNPLQYTVVNGELRERETDGPRTDIIIYDVQDFQLAYTDDDENLSTPANWEDAPANPEKVKAVWIYMILRTRERVAGHQENRIFRLPWDAGQSFNGNTLPAGFHYQEFQTQVWLRNAN